MRALPGGWPDPSEKVQTTPKVYFYMADSPWPAATDDLPAGCLEVATYSTVRELTGSLLPGQVRSPSGFSIATGAVTFKQPKTGYFGPWRSSAVERVGGKGRGQLIRSYDGPLGATAMSLGSFILDPVTGKLSDLTINQDLVEDWVVLRSENQIPNQGPQFGTPSAVTPDSAIADIVAPFGLTTVTLGSFEATWLLPYFPGSKDTLTCIQEVVAANLGAVWQSIDGDIVLAGPDYMIGAVGDPVETIVPIDQLEDLVWTCDPGEIADRVEVTYIPVDLTDDLESPPVWTPKKGQHINAGKSATFTVDPGRWWREAFDGPVNVVLGNTSADGSGTAKNLPVEYGSTNTHRFDILIKNPSASRVYLIDNVFGFATLGDRGTMDLADDQSAVTIAWGVAPELATNTVTVNLGKYVRDPDIAEDTLNRIADRVRSSQWAISQVRVAPNFGREIGDIVLIDEPTVGIFTKAMVTGISLSGAPESEQQLLDLVILDPLVGDFDAVWDTALPGATIADFNTQWAGKTFADFNANPLET